MVTLFRMRVRSHCVTAYECNCANCQLFQWVRLPHFCEIATVSCEWTSSNHPTNHVQKSCKEVTAIHRRCGHGRYFIGITTIGWLNSLISSACYAKDLKMFLSALGGGMSLN